MLAHVDGDVGVDHFNGDLLPRFEEADPCGVASVVVGLARLDAAGALQEGLLIHHYLIAGEVSEVDIVYLTIDEVGAVHQYLQLPAAGM